LLVYIKFARKVIYFYPFLQEKKGKTKGKTKKTEKGGNKHRPKEPQKAPNEMVFPLPSYIFPLPSSIEKPPIRKERGLSLSFLLKQLKQLKR